MDDNTKIGNQNVNSVVQDDQTQSQAPVDQPVAPTGSTNKEAGPMSSSISEFVKPSEIEPQIDEDLAELGIEAKKENPDLTDEHKQAGIGYAKETTPLSGQPSGYVKLPMSEEEVADTFKTGQDDDSGKWLAGLIKKVIKVMGFLD